MRTNPKTKLLIPLLSTFCMHVAFAVSGQDIAGNDYKPSFIAARHRQQNEPMAISLKEAVNQLKSFYAIKVAYKEGLLDSKIVPLSVTGNFKNMDVETALKQVLSNTSLLYKKTGNNQYSVFEPRNESNIIPIEKTNLSIPISGRVTSKTGAGLPMVTVSVKGSPEIATTSDENGIFKLSLPDEMKGKSITLVISSIGYTAREITIADLQKAVMVQLEESNKELGEVVVTALGIKKASKSLTYSTTEVKGSDFTQARENNVANALSGKVAGVNATGLSTGPGGSSRVVIRGNGSLTGNSQPLYVINGMPIDNSVPGGSATPNGITTNVDRGDGIGAINPDDIESISILKGGTAAALYGSRGANGVILITTKKGRMQKGIGVEYNTTLTMENASVFPDFQYVYGQGDGGVKPTTLAAAQASGRRSFGSKIDGSTDYVAADGKTHPYSAQRDNIKNFYQTGTTFTNSVALSGGNESILYRLSLSDLNAKSILPNSKYNRKTANLNLSAKLSDRLRIESVIQYSLETAKNRSTAGDALGNPNWTPYEVANTVDIRWLNPGYDAQGNEIIWNDAAIASNSYFVVNKFQEADDKNRFIGQASISYDILKNLTVKGTVTRDFYNYNYTNVMPSGTAYTPLGEYAGIKSNLSETNSMVTATYNTHVGSSFGINVMAGVNNLSREEKRLNLTGKNFIQNYFYSFSNLAISSTTPTNLRYKTNSVFGSVDIDFKRWLYLTATGRQDWFSTLSMANNSIFYPSVGASLVLSDALRFPTAFNLVKLRGSWAQVGGGGPDPYAINLTYSSVPSNSAVPLQNVTSASITNAQLKPFTSTTTEVGFNIQMYKNRLGLDVALYNRKSTNDIVTVPISTTSGYSSAILNSGQLSNKGIEVLLNVTPIRGKDFTWDLSYNFAYNKSEVLKLADGISTFSLGNSANGNAFINNNVGHTFGAIYGYRMLKDAKGQTIYDVSAGLPAQTDINQELGKGVPPITMGFSTELKYKNFSLSGLIDGKFGNKIFSVMEVYATRLGLLKSTLPGRESGLVLNGVTSTGAAYTKTVPISDLRSAYYNSLNRYTELFIHDASFVKLRQIILSYTIPTSKIKLLKVQSATISLVGRNLLTLYKQTDNFDPEQSLTNGAAQGIESIGLPRTRSYGVNLMLKF
ncbi:MAG: SusC/RagA family TonB-linked outer membrane protein [Chitinophagaceae bacterium]